MSLLTANNRLGPWEISVLPVRKCTCRLLRLNRHDKRQPLPQKPPSRAYHVRLGEVIDADDVDETPAGRVELLEECAQGAVHSLRLRQDGVERKNVLGTRCQCIRQLKYPRPCLHVYTQEREREREKKRTHAGEFSAEATTLCAIV